MKLRRWASLLLAASVGLFGQRAAASYTPLPDLTHDLASPLIETAAATAEPAATDGPILELVELYPIGQTDTGEHIELAVFVEPQTHTRVFYIVQSPLGLEPRRYVFKRRVIDGVPMVRSGMREWSPFWQKWKSDTVTGVAWRPASGMDLNYFNQDPETGEWSMSEYLYARKAMQAEPMWQNLERNSHQMYGCLALAGAAGGGGASIVALAGEIKAAGGFFLWYHGAREAGTRGIFWWLGTLAAAGGGANMQQPITAPQPQLNVPATAQLNQQLGNYKPDQWAPVTLKPGDIVYGATPGQSAFYVDARTAQLAMQGNAGAVRYHHMTQSRVHPKLGPRTTLQAYIVTKQIQAASSQALANRTITGAQGVEYLGEGGANQYFIENYQNALQPVEGVNWTFNYLPAELYLPMVVNE